MGRNKLHWLLNFGCFSIWKDFVASGEEANSFPIEVPSKTNGVKWRGFSVLFSCTPFYSMLWIFPVSYCSLYVCKYIISYFVVTLMPAMGLE